MSNNVVELQKLPKHITSDYALSPSQILITTSVIFDVIPAKYKNDSENERETLVLLALLNCFVNLSLAVFHRLLSLASDPEVLGLQDPSEVDATNYDFLYERF
jgi:hypothetical protein